MRVSAALLTLFSFAILAWAAEPASAERRVALVIGNSAYKQVAKLPNSTNDAASIAALFKKSGFDVVESQHDLTVIEMRRAIRDFSEATRDADIAVVFYAGHGLEVDGTNYLVPIDATLERDIDVEDESLSLDRIVKIMEPVRRLRLVILDACRDNPFTKNMRRTIASRSIGRGLARVEVTSSDTLIAFAAKAGSTAADGNGKHSPFTSALLKYLATPGLDLRLALGRVRDEVLQTTGNRQEPFVYGSLGGTTVALVPPEPTLVAAPTPSPVTAPPAGDPNVEVRRDYEFASQIGTKEAWDQFLSLYSTGFYAGLARAARDKLATDEARIVPPKAADQQTIAALAPPVDPPKPAIDMMATARDLQSELRRVGCYVGAANGEWSRDSRRALEQFNRRTGLRLDVRVASLDALDEVRSKTSRICPPQCERGFKAEADACVKVACPAGQIVGERGTCERRERTKSASRPAEPRRPRSEAAPAAAGPARVVCNRGGCLEVKPGCRAEANTLSAPGIGNSELVTCGHRR